MGNTNAGHSEMADLNNNGDPREGCADGQEKPHGTLDLPYSEDEVPEDIKAFFGHPLTAAETALHGDALALLHEYQHLPSIDKNDLRLADKYEIFNDLLSLGQTLDTARRGEVRRDLVSSNPEYMTLMATDVFLNRDPGGTASPSILDDDTSQKDAENSDNLIGPSLGNGCTSSSRDEFETFEGSPDDPLNLSAQIKQEELGTDAADQLLDALGRVSPSDTASELEASLTVSSSGLTVNTSQPPPHTMYSQADTPSKIHDIPHPGLRMPPRLIHMPPPPPGHVYVPTQRLLAPPPPGYVAIPAGINPRHIFPHEVLIPHIRPTADGQLQQLVPVAVGPPHMALRHPIPQSVHPPLLRTISAPAASPLQHSVINNAEQPSPSQVHAQTPPPPRYEDVQLHKQQSLPNLESECYIKTEDDSSERPSDSTKRIIQALNEKLKKKQSQKQPSDDDCVSLQEITNIINESISEEGDSPSVSEMNKCLSSVSKLESGWDWHRPPSSTASLASDHMTQASPVSSSPSPTVISPQQPVAPLASSHSLGPTYSDLKSPDSGFNECSDSCVSPADSNNNATISSAYADTTTVELGHMPLVDKIGKRRRSSASSSHKSICTTKNNSSVTAIPKLEADNTGFKYYIETGISTSQRLDEDRITYINKGQFYGLTLEYQPSEKVLKSSTVKSVIMVVFREEKTREDEVKAWSFWHSRQHSIKQRILDIDTKNSSGVLPSCIQEIAHNAVALRWNPRDQPAKVSIAINCLSTDFSNQKGVKGQPLHVQIDTFEDSKDLAPVHRAYCQIKIFCDKGAERKTRDEERRKEAKTKMSDMNGRKRSDDMFHPLSERSEFYSMADLTSRPVLFRPDDDITFRPQGDSLSRVPSLEDSDDDYMAALCSPIKRVRSHSYDQLESERVLLYVREEEETVFTALMVHMPTLTGLTHAIEEKYKIPAVNIENVYKKSRKGILVKMDDNIIRHYSNESTFVINISSRAASSEHVVYDITLSEIDGP